MRKLISLLIGLSGLWVASPALPDGERSGDFDYYVLSLSWSPNWCRLEGDAKGSPQCDASKDHGWILHGLWPQYHQGWPSYCPTNERVPSRSMTRGMEDIMGTSGLAWHQWKKHGTCAGMSAAGYFDLSRQAYEAIKRPQVLRQLNDPVTLPATLNEQAFLRDNPTLEADSVTVTCKQGAIQEVRICLGKDLTPVPCGRGVVKDCRLKDALFDPIR